MFIFTALVLYVFIYVLIFSQKNHRVELALHSLNWIKQSVLINHSQEHIWKKKVKRCQEKDENLISFEVTFVSRKLRRYLCKRIFTVKETVCYEPWFIDFASCYCDWIYRSHTSYRSYTFLYNIKSWYSCKGALQQCLLFKELYE